MNSGLTWASLQALLVKPIAYYRIFTTISGSVTAGLFLSQLFYWTPRGSLGGGWVYKSIKEWEEETGLSRYEQEGARAKLKSLGIIEVDRRGVPATLHFRICQDRMLELIGEKIGAETLAESQFGEKPQTRMGKTSKLVCGKSTNKNAGNQQTITEITPENSTKNSQSVNISFSKNLPLSDLASPTLTGDPGLTALDGGSQPGSATVLVGEIGSEDRSPANARIAERGMAQELDINKNPLPLPPPPQPEVIMTLADELIRRSTALCKKTDSKLASYQRKAIRAYPELARDAIMDLEAEVSESNTKNAAECLGALLRQYLGDRMNEFVKPKSDRDKSAAKNKKTSKTKIERQSDEMRQDDCAVQPKSTHIEPSTLQLESKPWVPEVGEKVYHPKLGEFVVRTRGKLYGGAIILMPDPPEVIEEKKSRGEDFARFLLSECDPIEGVA